MRYEIDSAWDEPAFTDVKAKELFGDEDVDIPEEVDNRKITPIFNQGALLETKMACGSYGLRHLINVSNHHTGGTIEDPKKLWRLFVESHKTELYDPLDKGSSLQDQLNYAKRLGLIEGYYKLPKDDVELFKYEAKKSISRGQYIYSGSKEISRDKTRKSKDKVAVFEGGSAHIICGDSYNKDYLFIRNSYGDTTYDKGYLYVRREDAPKLFTIYGVIDSLTIERKEKIREIVNNKKKNSVYKVKYINGRPVLRWRPI